MEVYRNTSAEELREKGWNLVGLPYLVEVDPDLIRPYHLENAAGKREAYLQSTAKINNSHVTIIYGLKRMEKENELKELAEFGAAHRPKA